MSVTPRRLAWLAAGFLTLHNLEEALTFNSYLARLPLLLPEPLTPFAAGLSYQAMLLALALVTVAAVFVAGWASRRPGSRLALWLLISLETTLALNVFVHVMAAAVVFGGYSPGLITAVAINAPFAVYFLRRASRERWVSPAALWATIPMALVLHGPVLIGGLWVASR